METVGKITIVVGVFLLLVLLQAAVVYALWDDTMVKFFNVEDVTFMDSIWISIISSALFKSYNNNN